MATTYIVIGTETRLVGELRQAIRNLVQTWQQFDHLKDIMDAQATAPDFSLMESLFGLPAGKGETVYNLVAGTRQKLNAADVKAIMAQLG